MPQPEAIVSMDGNGVITEFSQESESIFGYKAEDVVGQPLTELLIPLRFRRAHTEDFGRFLKSGQGKLLDTEKPIPLTLMRADQTEFPVHLLMTATPDGDRTIYRSRVQPV